MTRKKIFSITSFIILLIIILFKLHEELGDESQYLNKKNNKVINKILEHSSVTSQSLSFDIVKVPNFEDIKFFYVDADNNRYKNFLSLKNDLESQDKRLLFATNGGMFNETFDPIGLYIQNKVKYQDINTNPGPGNFHLLPNGVFYLTKKGAFISESKNYKKEDFEKKTIYATQSGPLLVYNNKIHEKFDPKSTNVNIRNGVGINDKGQAVFAISQEPVTFYDFAVLFKDKLNCQQALYLDGRVSQMYIPKVLENDISGNFGVIIAVTQTIR